MLPQNRVIVYSRLPAKRVTTCFWDFFAGKLCFAWMQLPSMERNDSSPKHFPSFPSTKKYCIHSIFFFFLSTKAIIKRPSINEKNCDPKSMTEQPRFPQYAAHARMRASRSRKKNIGHFSLLLLLWQNVYHAQKLMDGRERARPIVRGIWYTKQRGSKHR